MVQGRHLEEAPDEYDLGDADQFVVGADVADDLADGRHETRRAIALAAAAPKRKRRGEDVCIQWYEKPLACFAYLWISVNNWYSVRSHFFFKYG